jgi:hypothetical protein
MKGDQTMQTVCISEKAGKDGVLHLHVPVGQPETEFDAVIVLHPKSPALPTTPEERGWPPGYFDLAGSITDETFMRQPQGELPKPIDFE